MEKNINFTQLQKKLINLFKSSSTPGVRHNIIISDNCNFNFFF